MAPDPVPAPDGRVIVGFREFDPARVPVRGLPLDELQAYMDAGSDGPPIEELIAGVHAAVPDLGVVDKPSYDLAAEDAQTALIAQLADAPDAAAVTALFAEFERLYPDRVDEARYAFLREDFGARVAALRVAADTDARVALLMQAAADYAVAPARDARYAALDDGENYGSLYHAVGEIDAAAQARAPRSPYKRDSSRYDAGPLPEIAEVVSLVVPTLASVALDRLVDAVAGWLRRRRPAIPGTGQIARIYGPNGELLKEVEVTESTASRGR